MRPMPIIISQQMRALGRARMTSRRAWVARPAQRLAAFTAVRRFSAEAAPAAAVVPEEVPRPTQLQLRRLFVNSAVPFVAFGIVDQTVLIHAGDIIDNTMGVMLGLPTLGAAAMGQVLSDTCGVTFGSGIEAMCLKLGLPLPGLTDEQVRLGITKRVSTAGGACGIITGCLIGMCNLLFIDLYASERAKKANELETIMKTVMAHGRSTTNCDRATLWLVDEEAGELWSSVAHGIEGILRISGNENESVAAWVKHHATVANIPDVTKDTRWRGGVATVAFTPVNMLVAPVLDNDGKSIGVIQLLNKQEEGTGEYTAFNKSDEKVLRILCTHVAIFLEQLAK